MTNFIEEQLTEGMRERVAGIAITTNLVAQTLRAQRRRTMMTRTGYTFGVAGLAGALLAGGLAAYGMGPAATPERPPVAGAGSPQVRLAAAVTASGGISYRVKDTVSFRSLLGMPTAVMTGAFDPVTTTGYLRTTWSDGSHSEQRLVKGDLYTTDFTNPQSSPQINRSTAVDKPAPSPDEQVQWSHDPDKKYASLDYDPKTEMIPLSANPQQLLDDLTRSGAEISQTGATTYHFQVAIPARGGLKDGTMVGDVTVGSDHRVAKVVYQATLRFASETDVVDGTLELSDYGSPVTVARPPGTWENLPGK